MIARTWTGTTAVDDADAYLDYLELTGLREYRSTPGNRGVYVLRRMEAGGARFLLVSLWESMAAVRRFAGEPPERAVFYPEDERFLIDRDEQVQHWEILERFEVED